MCVQRLKTAAYFYNQKSDQSSLSHLTLPSTHHCERACTTEQAHKWPLVQLAVNERPILLIAQMSALAQEAALWGIPLPYSTVLTGPWWKLSAW